MRYFAMCSVCLVISGCSAREVVMNEKAVGTDGATLQLEPAEVEAGEVGAADDADAGTPEAGEFTRLVDDMTGIRNATGGTWYAFSDRTVPNSEPAVLTVLPDGGNPPGVTSPVEGSQFPQSADQVIMEDGTGPYYYREFRAEGESTWGAGFGMDFYSVPPDGGNIVPFNSCNGPFPLPDGSTTIIDVNNIDSGTVGIVLPYDASAYSGVSFYLKSFGASLAAVVVNIDDDQTSPWGGVCGACVAAATLTAPFECSDSWQSKVAATSTWTRVKVPFMTMTQDTWNNQGLKAGQIHTKRLYNLHFKFETAAGYPLPAVDIGVAYIQFYAGSDSSSSGSVGYGSGPFVGTFGDD